MKLRVFALFLMGAAAPLRAQHGQSLPQHIENPFGLSGNFQMSATPLRLEQFRVADEGRSTREILARLRNLEQICVMNSPSRQLEQVKRIDQRMLDLRKIVESRATAVSISSEDAPPDFLSDPKSQWAGAEVWKIRFAAQSAARKCELVELLSALSIARISTLAASKPICKFQDFVCDDPFDPLFQRDTRRLIWELRHFQDIEESTLPETPNSCRSNLAEMKERLKFGEATLTKSSSSKRWPLGRAIGMCARPMSAHYLDEAFFKDQIPEPKQWRYHPEVGWDEILDIEEIGLKTAP